MAKRGLYANINARKRAGTSRPKSKSTITKKAYARMKAGFPKKKTAYGSRFQTRIQRISGHISTKEKSC